MTDDRTFAVASDKALVELIARASNRLVVIAPALTKAVAEALSQRFVDLGHGMKVILDSDPEVYRLGFGDQEALNTIRAGGDRNLIDLREQPGVRIGVVISDDTTMVYSPVSKNIEAGSTTVEKPNAIVLTSVATDLIATAAGADPAEDAPPAKIGNQALMPDRVERMQADLKANPPKPFDITRRMYVFSSRVQYVEFEASNYRLTTRKIPLPLELVDVSDDNLRNSITGHIKTPLEGIGKVEIKVEYDGKSETIKVDDEWFKKERKRIEDEYTFQINNFGRVILYNDRATFDKATAKFKFIVERYQAALHEALLTKQSDFEKRIIDEFSPRWTRNAPKHFARWGIEATPQNIKAELQKLAHELFNNAVTFDVPEVKILYKNVAPENVQDTRFLDQLKRIMLKRRVPQPIIDSLFESGQAAPEAGAFFGQ